MLEPPRADGDAPRPEHADGEDPRRAVRERGLMEIIGDAFSIYRARFAQIVLISAVAQVPVSALAFIPIQSQAFSAILAFLNGAALTLVYAAVIAAVSQNCAFGRVAPAACYARVAWRGVSVLAIAALFGALSAAAAIAAQPLAVWGEEVAIAAEAQQAAAEARQAAESAETPTLAGTPPADESAETPPVAELPPIPGASALSFLALVALSVLLGVYMTTVAPSVIIEGRRGFGAVARGFRLARRSEWRIFGHLIIYFLVTIGLTIAVALPFFIAGGIGGRAAALALPLIGIAAAQIIAQPLTYIAATLLYYDIRLKSEPFGAARLSEEMGAPPSA